MCASTIEQGGMAGAEFSTDLTFSPRVPPEPLHVHLGVGVPQFGNRCSRDIKKNKALDITTVHVCVWVFVSQHGYCTTSVPKLGYAGSGSGGTQGENFRDNGKLTEFVECSL